MCLYDLCGMCENTGHAGRVSKDHLSSWLCCLAEPWQQEEIPPLSEEIRDTKLLVFSAASQVSVPPPTGMRQLCREEARCNPVVFLWSPLVIISPRDKSVEFPKPPCWLAGERRCSYRCSCPSAARLSRCSITLTQLHAGSVLGRLLSPGKSSVRGTLPAALPNTSGTLYEDSFLCALSPTRRPRFLSPARLSVAPRGGSRAAPRLHVNKRGTAGADWLRRTVAAPPSARTGAGGGGLQPGELLESPLCPFARRAFASAAP